MLISKMLSFLKCAINTLNPVPNINLTFPSNLPRCQEIALENHKDPRVLVRCLSHVDTKSFSSESFSEYNSADVGDINNMLKILEEKKWIKEKTPTEVLVTLYSADELKTFLQTHNLKVSGNKETLANRLLENIPFQKFKRKYKHTLYGLTELGIKCIQEKESDYDNSFISAVNSIKTQNFQGAVDVFNAYDSKWGFVHADGKAHTIFANRNIPHNRFNYIATYPMNELRNSNEFKNNLRSFILASMMHYKSDSQILADKFCQIETEPICCPNIIKLYSQNRDDLDKEDFERIISAMKRRVKENPDCVLDYYISKILYYSRHIS